MRLSYLHTHTAYYNNAIRFQTVLYGFSEYILSRAQESVAVKYHLRAYICYIGILCILYIIYLLSMEI